MQSTEMQNAMPSGGGAIAWRRLPLVALLAAMVAATSNALIYFAASGLGFIPQDVFIASPGGEAPLTVGPVVISSIAGAVGAAIVFALVGLFSRRPIRTFRIVAAVALVLSFVTPVTIPGAAVAMVLSLELMHVAAWAVIVGLLTTLARREKGETK